MTRLIQAFPAIIRTSFTFGMGLFLFYEGLQKEDMDLVKLALLASFIGLYSVVFYRRVWISKGQSEGKVWLQ